MDAFLTAPNLVRTHHPDPVTGDRNRGATCFFQMRKEGLMKRTAEPTSPPAAENLISRDISESILIGSMRQPTRFYFVAKFLIDILCASIGIVVLAPVFAIIALCIKINDGGSIFYRREMIGLGGRHFCMIKFRTMIPDAETYLLKRPELLHEYRQNMKLKHDPRITRIGNFLRRTYLDELPQLFNVLAGQMSLVGPRAIHENELALYGEYAQKRHMARPGITGLWQINPERHKTYNERIPLDMQYIDKRSLLFDLAILLKTVKAVLAHSGV